eukprot:PITA_30023
MSLGLRMEDRLDGHTNYSIWKERMQSIFEEAEVWDIMVHTTQNPVVVPTDVTQLDAYNKKNNKGKRLILDGVKDHYIPHVRGKRNAHEIWTALTNLYQSTNENWKMVLKEKLKTIKMGNDSAAGYLTKITNVRDELAATGEVIPPTELVRIAVKGLPRSWMNFANRVCALVCPEKKKKKRKSQSVAASTEIEDFADHFDREFGFTACESSSAGSPATQIQREHAFPSISGASSGIWYVDSGASCHMT